MNILLAGPKGVGKSTVGRVLSSQLGLNLLETDRMVEDLHQSETGTRLTCREIVIRSGIDAFKQLEYRAAKEVAERDWQLVSTGGGTLLSPELRRVVRKNALIVLISADAERLWERVLEQGIPPFLTSEDPRAEYMRRANLVLDVLRPFADVIVEDTGQTPQELADRIQARLTEELAVRSGQFSSLGEVFRVTTFGESHGVGIGAVLDGVPPGIELSEGDIQRELDRRRPGQSAVSTARKENDRVEILSGVFEGKTTGASIGLLIRNKDQMSGHYEPFKHLFRPGHADFTFWQKYGIRDYRGGGRSSGRETAARTAGGAVAKKVLAEKGVTIRAYALEIAGIRAQKLDLDQIERNPVRCPDPEAAERMAEAVVRAKEEGDSVGGIVQLEVHGLPAGLGDPVFGKLDAKLGAALFSLGTVKGVEIGDGFAVVSRRGSENNDAMRAGAFVTNHAGGILGGISTGAPLIARVAVKPTPSISKLQATCGVDGSDQDLLVEGRHDPCVVPRVVPVVETMAALVLLDAWLIQERLRGEWPSSAQACACESRSV